MGCYATLRFVAVLSACLILACPGCNKNSTNDPDEVATDQPAGDDSPGKIKKETTPAETAEPQVKTVSVILSTNVHAARLIISDAQNQKELHRVDLEGAQLELPVKLESDRTYKCIAEISGEIMQADLVAEKDQQRVELLFKPTAVREICRNAVCLIRLPSGGFGSGFLFGDRQTVVTAAHVLATSKTEDIKLVFNPGENSEEEITGAQIVYFDGKQDVALLHLPNPVNDERPFLWHADIDSVQFSASPDPKSSKTSTSDQTAKPGTDLIVIGNPTRGGGDYDPTYSRKAKAVVPRPDEFQINIEVKPGYSGGPVCVAENGKVLGLVSYKIVRSKNYEDLGKSFAKSSSIFAEARENWTSLNAERQKTQLERLAKRFSKQYGYRSASRASLDLYIDSSVFFIVCISASNEYVAHWNRGIANLNRELQSIPSLRSRQRKYKTESKALHKKSLKKYFQKRRSEYAKKNRLG
jgi:S1-C subfamily serine protease